MRNQIIRYRAVSKKVGGKVRWLVDQVVIRKVQKSGKFVAWDLYFQKTRQAFENQDPATWEKLLSRTPKEAAERELRILEEDYKAAIDDAVECFNGIVDLRKVLN